MGLPVGRDNFQLPPLSVAVAYRHAQLSRPILHHVVSGSASESCVALLADTTFYLIHNDPPLSKP